MGYFEKANVPMLITSGVKHKVPMNVCSWLFDLAFKRQKELAKKGIETSYFQVFNVTSKCDGSKTCYKVSMEQEQPDYTTVHRKIFHGVSKFNNKLWLIEAWNGKKEKLTPDDRYITLLLPDEY